MVIFKFCILFYGFYYVWFIGVYVGGGVGNGMDIFDYL